MTEVSLITDEMRAFAGSESPGWPVEVDRTAIRLFARSVGHVDRVYYDVEAAQAAGHRDLPCPPGFLGTPIFLPWASDPTSGGPLPLTPEPAPAVELTRQLNGGEEYELIEEVCAGDLLSITWSVLGYEQKQGRLGPMLISQRRATYWRDGRVVARRHNTHIQY